MSERVERMIKEYPSMVMERDCLRHQLANFQGVTEEEVIDSMTFSRRGSGSRPATSRTRRPPSPFPSVTGSTASTGIG